MRKIVLVFAGMAFIAMGSIQAQDFGIRGGLNMQNLNGKDSDGKSYSNDLAPRFHIGVDYEMEVAPEFYLAPGLLFSTKGSKVSEGDATFNTVINYLEVPINFVYKPELGAGKLIVAFGPYLAYGIGGKYKLKGEGDIGGFLEWEASGDKDIKFGSGDDDHLKPFDMGANIGFGYELSGGLSLKLNAQLGLVNIESNSVSDSSTKNTGFGLSLGYRF